MSKQVQIGNDVYIIPDAGENPGWGEDLTAFLEAVAQSLENVQGPNDILQSSATLSNNQSTPTDINGLAFNVADVNFIEVEFFIFRTFDSGSTVAVESGKVMGHYNGADFEISTESTGDAGIDITVTATGQFQYTSSDLANHVSSTIKFKARTIDE